MRFKLVCKSVNPRHTRFALFDREGANCGQIVILTSDVIHFISVVWKGDIDWRDHRDDLPVEVAQ